MVEIDHLRTWVGRTEDSADVAAVSPLERLAALLDHETPPWPPGELPPLAHWLYFLPRARQSDIGSDGHPRRGGFLPAVPLPRRMWAGSRIEFLAPIPLGTSMTKRSSVQSVEAKSGASGEMACAFAVCPFGPWHPSSLAAASPHRAQNSGREVLPAKPLCRWQSRSGRRYPNKS